MQRQASDLPTHRVEARQDNRLRRIIHDDLDAGSGLQSTDVTSLTADDATLDLIRLDMEHRDRVLNSGLRSYPLDRLDHDLLRLLVGRHLGLLNDLIDVRSRLRLRLVLQRLDQTLLGLVSRQARDGLQVLHLLLVHPLQVLLLLLH